MSPPSSDSSWLSELRSHSALPTSSGCGLADVRRLLAVFCREGALPGVASLRVFLNYSQTLLSLSILLEFQTGSPFFSGSAALFSEGILSPLSWTSSFLLNWVTSIDNELLVAEWMTPGEKCLEL